MRGRKPKAVNQTKLHGNPGGRKLPNQPTPRPARRFPCPPHVGEYGRALWRKIAPTLLKARVLTEWDKATFEAMCSAYDLMRRAEAELIRDGLTTADDRHSPKKHPACSVFKSALDTYAKLAQEFGLSPIARRRLDVAVEDEDPLDDFLRR